MGFDEHVKFLRLFYAHAFAEPARTDASTIAVLPKKPSAMRNALRIMHVRSVLENFRFFQDLETEARGQLPALAEYCARDTGSVLLRQGSPPGSCFIVLSGQVQSWVDDEQETPRSDSSTRPSSSCSSVENFSEDKQQRNIDKLNASDSFAPEKLGTCVSTLGPGTLLGEMALLKGTPCDSSIVCSDDSEFLVIHREHFDRVLKADMLRKQKEKWSFLLKHLPGANEVPESRMDKVAYGFEQSSFIKGRIFLEEGKPSDDCIYIVLRGSVEFRKRDTPQRKSLFEDKTKPGVRRLGTLIEGGLFGSLPSTSASSSLLPQAFTVVAASSPCEVLEISGRELRCLPPMLTRSVGAYLAKAATWRKQRCDGLAGVPGTCAETALPKRLGERARSSSAPHTSLDSAPGSASGSRKSSVRSVTTLLLEAIKKGCPLDNASAASSLQAPADVNSGGFGSALPSSEGGHKRRTSLQFLPSPLTGATADLLSSQPLSLGRSSTLAGPQGAHRRHSAASATTGGGQEEPGVLQRASTTAGTGGHMRRNSSAGCCSANFEDLSGGGASRRRASVTDIVAASCTDLGPTPASRGRRASSVSLSDLPKLQAKLGGGARRASLAQ